MSWFESFVDKLKRAEKTHTPHFKPVRRLGESSPQQDPQKKTLKKRPTAIKAEKTLGRSQSFDKPIISKKSDLPRFKGVLSGAGRLIDLAPQDKEHYLILKDESNPLLAHLVSSYDRSSVSNGVDYTALAIKDRLERKEFAVKTWIAEKTVIQLIYDEAADTITIDQKEKEGIEKEITRLFKTAYSHDVSDIHIEVRRNSQNEKTRVRWRENGLMIKVHDWSYDYAFRFCSVLYGILSEDKDLVFNPSRTQSARATQSFLDDATHKTITIECRIQVLNSASGGFDLITRIFPTDVAESNYLSMEQLGYDPEYHTPLLDRALSRSYGAIVISGITGSGKSTSLSNMISAKIADHQNALKVITVEDPVETVIPGTTQVSVNRKTHSGTESPFADAIRSALRSDGDVLMIGEIRDHDSAALLVQACQTGHQVLTTIHAPTPFSILPRLTGIGVSPDVMGSEEFLSILISQKLIQTLCSHCKVPFDDFYQRYQASEKVVGFKQRLTKMLGKQASQTFIRERQGCEQCHQGISGRTVIAEIVLPDRRLKQLFREGKLVEAKDYWLSSLNGLPMMHHALKKALTGAICPRDIEETLDPLDLEFETTGPYIIRDPLITDPNMTPFANKTNGTTREFNEEQERLAAIIQPTETINAQIVAFERRQDIEHEQE